MICKCFGEKKQKSSVNLEEKNPKILCIIISL